MVNRSKFTTASALLLFALPLLACNLSERLKTKQVAPAKPCFGAEQTAATQPRTLLAPEEGGFKVTLPAGFTTVVPPEPPKQGYEYSGTSYYSFNFPCSCRLNFTELTATGLPAGDDQAALDSRRDVVTRYQSPPATLDKEETGKVQNNSAISLYTTRSAEGKTEYNRYQFIVARGRIYEIHFASEVKEELDHPEVDAYFKSFELTYGLDSQVISKPEPEKSRLAFQQGKGTVVVEVTVGTDGRVKEAKAISGPIFLKPLAERAATKARFAPDKSERKGILTYQFK